MSMNVCVCVRTCTENIHDTRIVCHQLTICVRLCIFSCLALAWRAWCVLLYANQTVGGREKTHSIGRWDTHICLTTLDDNKFYTFWQKTGNLHGRLSELVGRSDKDIHSCDIVEASSIIISEYTQSQGKESPTLWDCPAQTYRNNSLEEVCVSLQASPISLPIIMRCCQF